MVLGYAGTIPLMGSSLKLCYVLNPGMAFGIQFYPPYGKLLLTLGRILITYAIIRHIEKLRRERPLSTRSSRAWTWILGGAVGNSIDSIFYGVLLENAPHDAPIAWGHGQVIDMIHLDLWRGQLPTWVPFMKECNVHLFPIFNLADVAILVGMLMILCSPGGCRIYRSGSPTH